MVWVGKTTGVRAAALRRVPGGLGGRTTPPPASLQPGHGLKARRLRGLLGAPVPLLPPKWHFRVSACGVARAAHACPLPTARPGLHHRPGLQGPAVRAVLLHRLPDALRRRPASPTPAGPALHGPRGCGVLRQFWGSPFLSFPPSEGGFRGLGWEGGAHRDCVFHNLCFYMVAFTPINPQLGLLAFLGGGVGPGRCLWALR